MDRRRPFAPWLHRIVVNRALDWARREALRRRVSRPESVFAPLPPPEEIGGEMMAALRELPAEQRAVVVLRHLLEYTPGEIAGMLELPRGTEQRGLAVVEAAYAERKNRDQGLGRRRLSLPRLALAFSIVTLMAALLLSPAGAAVRDWVGDVVDTSTPRPEPALAEIPGGGRLLVQSAQGPWVVQPDGARRLLGEYEEATWPPRGLFVAVVDGRTLSAVEPDGDPRWSITAAGRVGDPRWAPAGERIAYRSGGELRVVAGDGTGDRLLARSTAPVAPAWSPLGDAGLAYVSSAGMLRIAHSKGGGDVAVGLAGANVSEIEWGGGGSTILETSRGALRLHEVRPSSLKARPRVGHRRELPLPPGATVVDAALAPETPAVAAVITHWRDCGTRSSVVLFGAGANRQPRRLLTVPGSLGQVAWSPDGRRLLVAWPYADNGSSCRPAAARDGRSPTSRPPSHPAAPPPSPASRAGAVAADDETVSVPL